MGSLNFTTAKHVILFANYPPLLLDFAVGCCVLFMILGVPGNLITITALIKGKKVHNATGIFIINLTISDLMFGLINLPLEASLFGHRAWVHTRFLCLLFPILRYGLLAVSIFTVLAITINRYVMIAHQRLYQWLYTRTSIAIMVVATWVGAFGALVPTLLEFWGTFGLDPTIGSCTILPDAEGNSPKEFLFIFAFILPCLAICICYARIFCIVHRAYAKSHVHLQMANQSRSSRNSNVLTSQKGDTITGSEAFISNGEAHMQRTVAKSFQISEIIMQPELHKLNITELESLDFRVEHKLPTRYEPSLETYEKTNLGASILNDDGKVFFHIPQNEYSTTSAETSCQSDLESPTTDILESQTVNKKPCKRARRGSTTRHRHSTVRRSRTASMALRQQTLSTNDRRLLKMILVIFVSFVVCHLPITLIKFLGKDDDPILNISGLLLIYMTTCINPIIYVVMSTEYRQAYVSLLTCTRTVDFSQRTGISN